LPVNCVVKELKDSDSEDDVLTVRKKSKLPPVSSDPTEVDYETFPQASDGLDDFEFKNYAFLRSWRASRCRDLDLEAYKICQNRTLCEVIRRRRNDPMWGKDSAKFTEKLVKDLLECWGIGPSKVKYRLEAFNCHLVVSSSLFDSSCLFDLSCLFDSSCLSVICPP
jgi:hypothetical protein